MNKFRYTKIGQMLDVLRSHAVSNLLFAVLWMAFVVMWTTKAGGVVFTVIGVFSYVMSIYGCGEKAAKDDKKPYVPGDADLKKSFYIPLLLVIVNILFVVMYKLTWVFGSDGNAIQSVWAVITNILSFGWFTSFGGITGMECGTFSVVGILAVVLLPEIFYVLGYYAGMKNYDISEKLFGFMYEKKREDAKKSSKLKK